MDLGAVRVRVFESTAAISPSTNNKPVMVAGIIATQPRITDIASPLQPMENQAKRLVANSMPATITGPGLVFKLVEGLVVMAAVLWILLL